MMRRYLNMPKRSSSMFEPGTLDHNTFDKEHEGAPEMATSLTSEDSAATAVPVPPPNLKIKRVDYYYSRWLKVWKYKNMGDRIIPERIPLGASSGNDAWQSFCFVVVRTLPKHPDDDPTFHVVIKSPYLVQACQNVMQTIRGISWNADPLQLNPQLLIAFLPQFEEYHAALRNKKCTQEEAHIMNTISVIIDYLHKDYKTTIATIANLKSHGEITWDLLYAILIPRTVFITTCRVTGEPRALRLASATKISMMSPEVYDLIFESIDAVDERSSRPKEDNSAEAVALRAGGGAVFGKVESRVLISAFRGTVKINSLDAYPIKYDEDEDGLRKTLLARGRKWVSLKGTHHMQYKGIGAMVIPSLSGGDAIIKYNVNSRVMIDRATFRRQNPNYAFPAMTQKKQSMSVPAHQYDFHMNRAGSRDLVNSDADSEIPTLQVQRRLAPIEEEAGLSEDELILTPAVVYGFSLSDKLWLEFNVEIIAPIVWNDEAFENLMLPAGRKKLLQSLVEAHNSDLGFDDFVRGKGHGLVINLFGPPGVGKTLSAEATSEHVRRPLYVVGSGDLGTTAVDLDSNLQRIFDIATSWKAIVLIDEADVFLEQRSLHDLERNAMVAVFLRHVEYYRGILFLTTNRVKSFDEAFLSRIHVALHFQELTREARTQVWRAFLLKVGVEVGGPSLSARQLEELAERKVNGRQIKNATRTANSLAVSREEPLNYGHLAETLDAMEEFTNEFRGMSAQSE